MNSFEEHIKKQQLLQKSFAETFTGQNEVFKIIETLQKAGVPEDEMIEKAKYIRREGTKGNYKYIYEEPKVKIGQTVSIGKEGIKYKIKDVREGIATLEALDGQDLGNSNKEQKVKVEHLSNYGTVHKEQQSEKKEDNKNSDYKVGQRVSVAGWNNDSGKFNNWDDAGIAVITDTSKLSNGEITVRYLDDSEAGVNTIDVDHIKPWGKSQKQKSQSSDLQKAEQTEAQKAKIAKVMREFKEGKLKSSSGEVVKNKEQALAIALSEAGLSKK